MILPVHHFDYWASRPKRRVDTADMSEVAKVLAFVLVPPSHRTLMSQRQYRRLLALDMVMILLFFHMVTHLIVPLYLVSILALVALIPEVLALLLDRQVHDSSGLFQVSVVFQYIRSKYSRTSVHPQDRLHCP
jgi:hypothetical protein